MLVRHDAGSRCISAEPPLSKEILLMFTQLLSSFVPHANVSRPNYDVAQGGVTYEDGGEDYSMA